MYMLIRTLAANDVYLLCIYRFLYVFMGWTSRL